ncbi:hypothetical protein BGZ59_010609 [Podila verticillata]|nr:hypothetical protein BGZ59_010609 [Podila verticillata]
MTNSFLSTLPVELLPNILCHLSSHDISQCVLANKAHHALCTPYLWKTIKILDPTTFCRFKTEEMQKVLAKNAHLIQDLETRYLSVIKWIVQRNKLNPQETSTVVDNTSLLMTSSCQNLTRLCLGGSWEVLDPSPPLVSFDQAGSLFAPLITNTNAQATSDGSGQVPGTGVSQVNSLAFESAPAHNAGFGLFGSAGARALPTPRTSMIEEEQELIVHLITSNPNLQLVSLYMMICNMEAILSSVSAARLPLLRDLIIRPCRLCGPLVRAHAAKTFFEGLSETIRSIHVEIPMEEAFDPEAKTKPCLSHPCLKVLNVLGDTANLEEYLFLDFLKSCSTSLTRVELPGAAHLVIDSLYQVLDDLGLTDMTRFNLGYYCLTSDHILARIVSRSHQWQVLDLSHQWGCQDLTAEAIVTHCQELQELTITQGPLISSSVFQRILCRAAKLVYLHANYDCCEGAPENSQLQATDVISSLWACRSLKTFRADIVGIPRPDVKFQQDRQPVQGALFTGTVEASHDIQRRILAQLGSLTKLEELCLGSFAIDYGDEGAWTDDEEEEDGMRYLDPHFQLTCLEMSLASGLDLLAGLKELRVLDVTRMAHRVGVQELEWMQANWPSLEIIHGLFNDFYPPLVPGVRDWLEEHKPKWGEGYLGGYNDSGSRGG